MPPRDRTRRRLVPRQERAQASVEAILGAAELLLAEGGFSRLTTNRVAERAGVNVALVYRYFAGKEAIVGALIERTARATEEAVGRVLAASAARPLPALFRALVATLMQTPSSAALHRELVEHVGISKRRRHLEEMTARTAAAFAGLLAARRSELRADLDLEAALFVLQHALEAATHAGAFYRPASLAPERVADAIAALVERALLP